MLFNTKQFNSAPLNVLYDGNFETVSTQQISSSTDWDYLIGTSSTSIGDSTTDLSIDFNTESVSLLNSTTVLSTVADFAVTSVSRATSETDFACDFATSSAAQANTSTALIFDISTATVSIGGSTTAFTATTDFSTSSIAIGSSSFVLDWLFATESSAIVGSTTECPVIVGFATSSVAGSASTTTTSTVASFLTDSVSLIGSTTSLQAVIDFVTASTAVASSFWALDDRSIWCLNAETGAAWTYTNYPFNSACDLNGTILAAGSGGLYVVDQTTDAGSDVIAEAKSGLVDFNSQALKNILSVDVIGQFASAPVIKVSETGAGALREWHYKSTYPADTAYKEHVIKTGRGLRSRYYGIAVQVRGAATVERINPQMVQLKTRH